MADKGGFRTVLSGFHKADVLEYIDVMQSRYADDLRQYQEQITELRSSLTAKGDESVEMKARIEQMENEIAALKAENIQLQQAKLENPRYAADIHRMTQEVENLRLEKKELLSRLSDMQQRVTLIDDIEKQNDSLRLQIERCITEKKDDEARNEEANVTVRRLQADKDNLSSQLKIMQSQLQEAEQQLVSADESNRRYDGLVGDAGAFIVELYTMGQRFLETAYKRSDGCLGTMESSLSALSSQMNDARQQVKQARQELLDHGAVAGLRLDELVQSLERSAGILSDSPQTNKPTAE